MTLVFSIAAVLKTLEQLLEKTNCVALDLSLRKKFSKIYLIVIHGCRDERKYTHFSVLYGMPSNEVCHNPFHINDRNSGRICRRVSA